MNICNSWEHDQLVWDGSDNGPCPLCQALKLGLAKDKVIEQLQKQVEDEQEKRCLSCGDVNRVSPVKGRS